jgi:ElaB/YqjD/DUF883 family membrane-anchored ribosome-binding protein
MSNDRYGYPSSPTEGTQNATSTGISEMATTAGEEIGNAAQQAQVVAQEQYDKLSSVIRAKPMQAVGIAIGVGFVLALVARR